ncbi:Zinc finger CCHC domain-containing 8 [Gossypium australe]|uniref:Zinc finger CCHC domain-containing 8 n=1 Tax=Gossypium australe TaxID=47621 RepID=A0A5B6UUA0_9ROSI|nr:Zinc finger CCHC domain-containing 8 [Gossypium australe]
MVPGHPQNLNQVTVNRPTTDKIRKCGAEFRGLYNSDLEKVEYWLENTQHYSPEDNLKCVVSLLKEYAYQWWVTLTLVVLRSRVT